MCQEIVLDQPESGDSILTEVFTRINLSFNSMIDLTYYACKIFKNMCLLWQS